MPHQTYPGGFTSGSTLDRYTVIVDNSTLSRAPAYTPAPVGSDFSTPAAKWRLEQKIRSEVARIAAGNVDSLVWREDTGARVQCSRFVDDVLTQVFASEVGRSFKRPPRLGGWRGVYYEWFSEDWGKYPPVAGDWAAESTDIPLWKIVDAGPVNACAGDIISERINYGDASGHVGIVIGLEQTVSADSSASPPGKITNSNYGFRLDTDTSHDGHGHLSKCKIRRFTIDK